MTNSEEKLRGQIFDLEDDLQFARSKNTQGVHIKKDLEKNYADVTLKIASCANKMDSDRFDYRDQPKPSNGSGEYDGAGQDGKTEDPFDIDTLDDENETIQYPNLSRYALETESQNDLREFTALKPPESVASNSRSGYSSSSPVCTLPDFSADLSEDFDTETPLYNGNYMSRDERTKTQQYQAYKDPNAYAKPNTIDLQRRRRSNTYATKGVVRNEENKRSYSLVDSPVPLTPKNDATPLINETYLEDESAFTPDGYEYDQAVDSSPSVTGVSEQSPGDLSYGLVDPGSTQDDSDSEFENFIEQRRDFHANDPEDGRASPYYPREQTQEPSTAQPYLQLDPASRKVVMRQQKPQVQKKRQTMPPQNENYTEYVAHRPPATPKSKSRSNYQVPDPNLVLRPVASANEGQKYASTFRKRKTSNNTISGYPTTSSHQLETERKYSNTIPTKDAYMKYHPEYSRVQGAQSAFLRYPISHPHQGDISPDALSDDVYLNSQPYETTINSSDIMNTQQEFEPQYQYHANSRNRRPSMAHQAYVSPQHSAVTPVNQNYYIPNYDSSPVDSGIYSLHNFADRPQTVAAQLHYQHQDFNYDDETADENPSIDVKELVSHLQQQITFLSSRIKRFEDRRKSSQSQELLSPHSETPPVLSPPHSFRSPSATSTGSEGARRKKQSPPRRMSPNFNSPLPSNHSKPAVYSQPDKFRETEQRFRYNLPQTPQTPQSPRADSKSRVRELVRDIDRPQLHSQLSAPNINRPRFISRATSGQSEGERGLLPPRASPIPTTQNSLHPYTRHEASQNAFNVTRARSSMDASHSMLPTQKKLVTRYQAPPPPAPIKSTHSVSPQPRPILRTPRNQHPAENSRISDGYHYDEDSFKNKKSAIPRVDYKREYY